MQRVFGRPGIARDRMQPRAGRGSKRGGGARTAPERKRTASRRREAQWFWSHCAGPHHEYRITARPVEPGRSPRALPYRDEPPLRSDSLAALGCVPGEAGGR